MPGATVLTTTQSHPLGNTENWDDDFEFQHPSDKTEQPPNRQQRPASSKRNDTRKMSIASSAAFEDWDAEERQSSTLSRPSSSTSQTMLHQHAEQQTDNWDDDFEEDARNSPRRVVVNASPWGNEMDLEEEVETDDENGDFGFADREEDRTVTAKSRRAALQRLSSSSHSPPPPPMPPLVSGPYQSFSRPFPARSPNSSVFSVPTTAQTHDYSSTTHLRPTSAFALLPPSPPLHKERERRRLRKKSRPKPQGTFELTSLRGSSINASETRLGSAHSPGPSQWYRNRCSFSDDGDAEHSACEPTRRLRTETPTDNSSADDRLAVASSSSTPAVPQTPVKTGALLSRIGSVKKWGVRRKRASTTPSEVAADQQPDPQRTPRVQASRTSFHANTRNSMSSSPPRQPNFQISASTSQQQQQGTVASTSSNGSSWFFRATSTGSPNTVFGSRTGSGASSRGDKGKQAETVVTTTTTRGRSGSVNQNRGKSGGGPSNSSRTDLHRMQVSAPSTPSKLLKKKSLGFMQLKKSTTGGGGAEQPYEESRVVGGSDGSGSGVRESPRKGGYVGIGLGRAAGRRGMDGQEDDGQAPEASRGRRKSLSKFLLDRDKGEESNSSSQGGVVDNDGDGSRGFMGSVRRISLVGMHKRTKSGSGVLLSITERAKAPPLPPSTKSKPPSTNLPYSLPPLPITNSQVSLRLPTPSSLHVKQNSRHSSMYDLPLAADPPIRVASTSSTQSQASSVIPSSTSDHSSTNHSAADLGRRPIQHRKRSSTRSRTSEEGRRRKSTSSRKQSGDGTGKILPPSETESSCTTTHAAKVVPLTHQTPTPPPPLLPPIELQPPSPPLTVSKATQSQLTICNGHGPMSSPPFSAAPLSSSSSNAFITPPSSPSTQLPASSSSARTHKLSVPASQIQGKTLVLQQSASLGRATAAAGAATFSASGDGNGSPSSSSNGASAIPMRRNSLGDLKIPARISQAQVGLKRDLGMVREFANNIEQLKDLQQTYENLMTQVDRIIEAYAVQQGLHQKNNQTSTTNVFSNLKSKNRGRSNTNPTASQSGSQTQAYQELVSTFHAINSRYRIAWECADLLIELGGGGSSNKGTDIASAPPTSTSAPIISQTTTTTSGGITTKRSRERAITLGGDDSSKLPQPLIASSSLPGASVIEHDVAAASGSNGPPLASPPSTSWRASTGRNDLSQRQLVLLREMLNNTNIHSNVSNDTNGASPEAANSLSVESQQLSPQHPGINKDWKWGDAGNSTVTLPSEDTDQFNNSGKTGMERKRRSGRLGMIGLRDLLRALKWSTTQAAAPAEESNSVPPIPPIPVQSTTSLSTSSSTGSKRLRKPAPRQSSQPRRKPRTDYESVRSTLGKDHRPDERATSPYVPSFVAVKSSPRRPSLASIFRIGNKNRPSSPPVNPGGYITPETDAHAQSSGMGGADSSGTEEDWDRMDSASDLDGVAKLAVVTDGSATVRVECQHEKRRKSRRDSLEHPLPSSDKPPPPPPSQHSILPKRSFSASQSSVRIVEPPFVLSRAVRLSNVEEHETDNGNNKGNPGLTRSASQSHARSPSTKPGSVRSMPPHLVTSIVATSPSLPVSTVAMTPENIKPLLANARDVQARLCDCIAEIQALLDQRVGGEVDFRNGRST